MARKRSLLSLRHWKHVFVRIYRLIRSPLVKPADKLLFLLPVALYWVLPDVMPFVPVDDIAVTMFAAEWFTRRAESKYPNVPGGS
ncbi:hypothetical protein DNH61_10820 [Paenibacillus sambharensis]|uniref:Uncharacterized protein n=1 Tax=Paenibacillus sambharensis TaxID=1803190 RepID=A0A2W1LN87_9BACL|nr:hypothetical protein [Paenibacillus sambharensis]PZD95924.1 hypothetical protein DNH61_10820 [Paenibacillus sambharensis]